MDGSTLLIVGLSGVLIAISVFVFLVALIYFMTPEYNPVRDRLMALKAGEIDLNVGQDKAMFFDTLTKLSEPISKNLYGKDLNVQNNMKRLLTEAGEPDNDRAVWQFLAKQIAMSLVMGGMLGMVIFFMAALKGGVLQGLMFGAIALIIGLLLGRQFVIFGIKGTASKRKTEIRYSLSDVLDLMVVCVEAGLGLDATVQRVGIEASVLAPELSHEFRRVNKELNAGIPRVEAFQNLGTRAGVDELQSLCNMLVQSDKLGTSIAEALRIYADDVRTRRRQKAEELASKASIKMTFPLVLFIFPPMFIVLMGPMVIQALGTFFGK